MVAQTGNFREHLLVKSSRNAHILMFIYSYYKELCHPKHRTKLEVYNCGLYLKIIRVPNLFTFCCMVAQTGNNTENRSVQMSSSGIACISMCIYLLMLVIEKILDRTFFSLFRRYIHDELLMGDQNLAKA